MKKIVIILIVIALGIGIWYLAAPSTETATGGLATRQRTTGEVGRSGASGQIAQPAEVGVPERTWATEEGRDEHYDDRPATEIYTSAEQALEAVRRGAVDYNDLVLEQFSELGEQCAWCNSFYASVKEMMFAADASPDQRSYYAEVLSVSGRMDNIKTLVDATKNAASAEDADIYAEALELSILGDDAVSYLKEHLNSDSEILKEAVVAAMTNQGSRLTTEILYQHTVEQGDPDGYYTIGIGLGEIIPEPEAFPLLQEIVDKRDDYSHLGVKALLNAGLPGLTLVMDSLNRSKDQDSDRRLLEDGVDHVAYDEETEEYLQQIADNSSYNPLVREFAKQVLDDYQGDDIDFDVTDDDEEEEEEDEL